MHKVFGILLGCLGCLAAIAEPVNINAADAETIAGALKNIGPKKAAAIVEYRKQHGDFKSLKEFENVKGIGGKTALVNEKDILFSPTVAIVEKKTDTIIKAR